MPQKKVLKLKPKTKIICKILAIIIIALAVFLGYYLHSRNELKKQATQMLPYQTF